MVLKLTHDEFLSTCYAKHGDKYDYTETVYTGSNRKVKIICHTHGMFIQTANAHMNGSGCRPCANIASSMTHVVFLQRAIHTHGNRYDYTSTIYEAYDAKVLIRCKVHGIFSIRAGHHITGQGCQKCKRIVDTESFLERCISVHGDTYDYSLTKWISSGAKVEIRCKLHGSYFQLANNHIQGRGCPECSKEKNRTPRISFADFVARARATHGDKYEYPPQELIFGQKIDILCKTHGLFRQPYGSHVSKATDCPKCVNKGAPTKSLEQFIMDAQSVHGETYDYSSVVYINSGIKVKIICRKHDVFEQKPNDHIFNSQGCPRCAAVNSSKVADMWLSHMGIEPQNREKIVVVEGKSLKCDGFKNGKVYEFHGDYYHGNPKFYHPDDFCQITKKTFGEMYRATALRSQRLEEAGYEVVAIWEYDFLCQVVAGEIAVPAGCMTRIRGTKGTREKQKLKLTERELLSAG